MKKRKVCFVTGTRAEFGLMRSVLEAIGAHSSLRLQIIVTGMHLQPLHGRSIDAIRGEGWKIGAVVPWKADVGDPSRVARSTGLAIAGLSAAFKRLKSDIVIVVGDRVEAFAAAAAGHVSQLLVAHVHGGDRAPGQIDDSLRHAITKLSHIHFPAAASSAARILKLGEDRRRIHCVGSPGIDGITRLAASRSERAREFPALAAGRYALIVLHPVSRIASDESQRAGQLLSAVQECGIEQTVVVYPNNDPGSAGIIRTWTRNRRRIAYLLRDIHRPMFLALMRDAAMLVGNSSSGIIEAASFGTLVVDIGPRQQGRDRSENVMTVPDSEAAIRSAINRIWNDGHPRRWRGRNIYGRQGTGKRIAAVLAGLESARKISRKVITY